jgi:hypothetical protein
MSASLSLLGIKELIGQFDKMPDAVRDESQKVIRASAMNLYRDLGSAIPVGPGGVRDGKRYAGGALRRSVKMRHVDDLRSLVWYGTNPGGGAPHGHLYEHGTKSRRNYKRKHANRGSMPASKVIGRLASAQRRVMNDELVRVLDSVLSRLGRAA